MNTTGDWWFSDICRTILNMYEYVVCLFLTLYNKCGYMFSFKMQFLFDLLAEQTSRWRRTRQLVAKSEVFALISNHPAFEWKQVDQTRPNTNNLGQSNLHASWHGIRYAANIKFLRLPLVVSQHFSDTIQSKIWTYHIIQYNTVVPSTTGAVCWHRCGCVQIVAHRKGAMWKLLLSTSHNHLLADLRYLSYLCTALTENIWSWHKKVFFFGQHQKRRF